MTFVAARGAGVPCSRSTTHRDVQSSGTSSCSRVPGLAAPAGLIRRTSAQLACAPVLLAGRRGLGGPRPAAATGGGDSVGGGGAGGLGGGGGGDGFSGGSGGGGWDARRTWTLIYAISLIGGGLYAYLKKGSRASLYASSAVGFCLLAAVWQMGVYPQAGMGIALVTSAVLTVAMGNRYRKSRKFMPSGMVALVSLVSASWYANWPQ